MPSEGPITDRDLGSALSIQKLEQVQFGQASRYAPSQESERLAQEPKRYCDICQRPLPDGPDLRSSAGAQSLGRSTVLCQRCQEDILNSNRLLQSHASALEKTSNLSKYQQNTDPEFFQKSQ